MKKTSIIAVVMIFAIPPTARASAEPIMSFLQQHCAKCHNSKARKADRRFDNLPKSISSVSDLERYQEIVDQLNLQAMPPEAEPQPTAAERAAVIDRLTETIQSAREQFSDHGRHSVLRRLNAWEYRQTIGDLLNLNVDAWNPAEDFPTDVKREGFDNNGDALVTSGILLEQYLVVAEEAIRRTTHFGPRPEFQRLTQKSPFYFSGKEYDDLPKLFHIDRFRFTPETPYTDLYGRHYRGGHIGFLPTARGGLKHSGNYTIRVQAAAVDRVHDYGNALGDFRNGDPLVLEIAAVDRRGSVESTGSISKQVPLRRVELTSDEPQWIEWTGYIDSNYEPEIRFRNGPLAAKRMVRLLTTKAADHREFKPFLDLQPGMEKAHGVLKAYRGPKLQIWEIQVRGPHVSDWPPRGHQLLYGDLQPGDLNEQAIVQRIRIFAEAAFRRPPQADELHPILNLVTAQLQQGTEPLAALQIGFQAVLCAPGFLYLNEGEGPLDDYALATRLSYFLWSSQPDETLRTHAENGEIRNLTVLRGQVRRMLKDPKSDRFIRHFVRRWLDTDNIGEMPPSMDFLPYYRDNLATAMRRETETFFGHLLNNNLSPREFLTADYSFLNRELATHYGIDGVTGSQMQRVSLQGTARGGLLGQGLFLTASANGVDTSPVVRGIYVLEKLLGQSPPPPPPDVPTIEPDIRGAKTIREQLAKHRHVATCAECHRKIDPLGFALEHFDAVGGWRTEYGRNLPIDASGQLPGGDTFKDVSEFRQHLRKRESQFTRNLTRKLLTYAIGRDVEIGDRPVIEAIVKEMQSNDGGLRDLITLIVLSDSFRSN